MGLVTIPMAVMTVGSAVGAVALLMMGAWQPVLIGMVAFVACLAFAPVLEQLVVMIDTVTVRTLERRGRLPARLIAIASGSIPMIALLAWEIGCFRYLATFRSDLPHGLLWLWSYGVATGPWTVFALRVSRFRRTLCGIRAYAGHLAYWLLSIAVLGIGLGWGMTIAVMALPAILPFIVGMLLALADRDALTNVRV